MSTTRESPVNAPQLPKISIVMPVHNEATSIGEVLRGFHAEIASPLRTNILVCEDGSTDGTQEVLRQLAEQLPMKIMSDRSRLGYSGGVARGLRLANTDVIFFSDSDGQYDPKDFWLLAQQLDGFDMVIGQKVVRKEPLYRIVLARGFHVLVKLLFGVRLQDIDCGFRLIRREVVASVLASVGDLPYSFWAEFTLITSLSGFRIKEVPVSHHSRLHGNTSIYKPLILPRIILSQARGLFRLRRRIGSLN